MIKEQKNTNRIQPKPITILIFFLLLILIITLSGCKKVKRIENPMALGFINNTAYIINTDGNNLSLKEYDEVKPYYDDYLMVKKNGKWGYIKNNGELSTKIIYDEVYPMKENKAVVSEKGKLKIIDNLGNTLYIFENGYYSSSFFQENTLLIENESRYGYLKYDKNSNSFLTLVEPTYEYASTFNEGFASVGILENGYLKYSYINENGKNIFNDFLFDSADDVSCGMAKVGFNGVTLKHYQYLIMPKDKLSTNLTPTYLVSKLNNKIVRYQYATRFSNNLAFIANYVDYEYGDEESNTLYYKDFSFIDVDGNCDYEYGIDDIGKKLPKNFYPYSPIFINDVLIFFNATRSIPVCKIIRETKYRQSNGDDGYDIIHEFKEANYNIDENSYIIQQLLKDQKWTFKMASSYLKLSTELKPAKFIDSFNTYITASKISANKWSIVKIISTEITSENMNDRNLDKYDITLEYIVPFIYDNIIY